LRASKVESEAPADRQGDAPTTDSDSSVAPEGGSTTTGGGLNGTRREETAIRKLYTLPRTAYRIYASYAKQLWTDTNASARKRIANDKVRTAIRETQHILTSEYAVYSDVSNEARKRLLLACNEMLACLPQDPESDTAMADATSGGREPNDDASAEMAGLSPSVNGARNHVEANNLYDTKSTKATDSSEVNIHAASESNCNDYADVELSSMQVALVSDSVASSKDANATSAKKKPRSVLFGAIMGAVVACWVFSGNYIFTGIFCLMTILGQLEYYRMVMNTGVFPARRISVLGATSMFVTVREKNRRP
jgi:hypothetical protein